MLDIIHVTKKYKDFTALSDVNIQFDHGVYGLLAPNGAGKTTLMKLMTTLLFPTSGKIMYNGRDIAGLDGKYREKLGYLPQEFGYYKDYSPKRYLHYLGVLKGVDRRRLNQKIDGLLELVGLLDVKNKKMKQFSGGMIQRVGIAQALLGDPEILILDEPTAGLDPKERMRFRKILSALSKDKTVIISTHIVSDVEFIANHIVMLKNKTILCNAEAASLCQSLNGMVYETKIFEGELPDWEERCQILSQRQEGDQLVIRFVGEEADKSGCVLCSPSLEDVFLYTYRE